MGLIYNINNLDHVCRIRLVGKTPKEELTQMKKR
jgi:hypothetical protein